MKFLLLILFLVMSAHTFAGYMSKTDLLDCEKSGRTFYGKSKLCNKHHSDCVKVPKKFICETYAEIDGTIKEDAGKKALYAQAIKDKNDEKKARKDEIQTIKSTYNAFISSSGKPAWEKTLLRRMVSELRK